MIIAQIEIGIGNSGIKYNTPGELGTDKYRGSVLTNGEVLRGLGTHYASVADKERHVTLTHQQGMLRMAIMERFPRAPQFKSTYILEQLGEANAFVDKYIADNNIDKEITVNILEGEFTGVLNGKQVAEWGESIKEQLVKIRLGGKNHVKTSALDTLEMFADFPAIAPETAASIRKLIGEFRLGGIPKEDFIRSIGLIDVKVNPEVVSAEGPRRAVPEVR